MHATDDVEPSGAASAIAPGAPASLAADGGCVDEVPQLWMVVTGQMSLVGPRPFPDYHLAQFPSGFLELRCRVRPGITGLWQIMVRNEGGIEKQQAFDTYYIRNWSVWLDLYVLSRTIAAVASGRGAY